MDKEKEIQEFAEAINDTYLLSLGAENYIRNATLLYNAGYRKADEVRKETAEDVLLCIMCSRIPNKYGTFSPEWEVLCGVLSDIHSLITERFNLRRTDE